MKILVIDDDDCIREAISIALSFQMPACDVLEASDGQSGLRVFRHNAPDAVVLDIGLPGISGLEVLERIRESSSAPILMLSGRDAEADIVRALEMGADDYITKPCSYLELSARLKAVLRRADSPQAAVPDQVFRVEGLAIHFPSQTVEVNNRAVSLTNTEYRLLYHLVCNAGHVVSHRALLQQAWGSESYGADVVRVYVSRLRTKIEPERDSPRYILTRPGVGYLFAASDTDADNRRPLSVAADPPRATEQSTSPNGRAVRSTSWAGGEHQPARVLA